MKKNNRTPSDISMTLNCFHAHKASTHKKICWHFITVKENWFVCAVVQFVEEKKKCSPHIRQNCNEYWQNECDCVHKITYIWIVNRNWAKEVDSTKDAWNSGKSSHELALVKAITKLCTPIFFYHSQWCHRSQCVFILFDKERERVLH